MTEIIARCQCVENCGRKIVRESDGLFIHLPDIDEVQPFNPNNIVLGVDGEVVFADGWCFMHPNLTGLLGVTGVPFGQFRSEVAEEIKKAGDV